MKEILNQLFEHKKLDRNTAREVLTNISQDKYNDAQIAAFISVYLMRSISVEELDGFRTALLDLCRKVNMEGRETIDLCGTGGDGKNTFNISTLSSFVVAGAGYQVTKHGNYGVSSACGSSNVLEHLGYNFTNDEDTLKRQIDAANICFLHAPLFHPALKGVGPIRRQLGVKTFFNMLGPLVNPAEPKQQLVGVFNLKLARLYQYLHENLDKNYTIVHSIDGYDEVSLTGPVKLIKSHEELLATPSYFNMKKLKPEEIFGGNTIDSAAQIFQEVIRGNGTQAQTDVIVANSALAIQCFDFEKSIEDCIEEARESIHSGRAHKALTTLIATQ
jgi:anthranilate phosphoribosyltransferase